VIDQLEKKSVSAKYQIYYLKLFIKLRGAKGKMSHKDLAILWGIEEISIKNILLDFYNKGLIARDSRPDNNAKDNRHYLFISLLIAPTPSE
jgi:transcription initiation factor IIE alpha subunit